jgi:geranylgeranyl pyrophosphate synthase
MLAALALINRAYFLAWRSVADCDPDCRTRALAFLEKHLGVSGLVNGQSMDLHYGDLPQNAQSTEAVAIGKTVALIRLTLVLPALLGAAPTGEIRLLSRIAFFWGLSYQIVDDLKDVLQDSMKAGKTVSRDLLLNRPNVALMLGVAGAANRLQRMIRIGDSLARRLTALRPGMQFLDSLREELGQEAKRMMEATCGAGVRGPA